MPRVLPPLGAGLSASMMSLAVGSLTGACADTASGAATTAAAISSEKSDDVLMMTSLK
jgi:hypothetical protein